jgi:hypothetical protein
VRDIYIYARSKSKIVLQGPPFEAFIFIPFCAIWDRCVVKMYLDGGIDKTATHLGWGENI